MKELKNILDALGVKKDDYFEKADLIRRVEEYKEQKAGKKAAQNASRPNHERNSSTNVGGAAGARGSTSTGPQPGTEMPTGDFTFMPTVNQVCFKITSVGN